MSGKIGALVDNPNQAPLPNGRNIRALVDNPNQAPLPNGRPRRRVRSQVTGTVLRSLDHRKWEVCLDCNNEIVAVAATNVKVIGHEEGLPLVSFSVLILFI